MLQTICNLKDICTGDKQTGTVYLAVLSLLLCTWVPLHNQKSLVWCTNISSYHFIKSTCKKKNNGGYFLLVTYTQQKKNCSTDCSVIKNRASSYCSKHKPCSTESFLQCRQPPGILLSGIVQCSTISHFQHI